MSNVGRRRKRERSYVTIENAMFEDEKLSFKAKGILGYLLTKPDGWIVRVPDLVKHAQDGEKAIRSGIKELKANGYLHFYRTKNPDGTFKGIVWEYDDIPYFTPSADFGNVDEEDFPPHADYGHVDEGHVDNGHDDKGTCISNDLSCNNQDFNNKEYNNLVLNPDVIYLLDKIFDKTLNIKTRNELLQIYEYHKEKISVIEYKKILINLKPSIGKVDNFKAYARKSIDNFVKIREGFEKAQIDEKAPSSTLPITEESNQVENAQNEPVDKSSNFYKLMKELGVPGYL